MSLMLTFPAPSAPMSDVPSLAALARIAEETDLAAGVGVAGELVPARRGAVARALADALHALHVRGQRPLVQTGPGRRSTMDVFRASTMRTRCGWGLRSHDRERSYASGSTTGTTRWRRIWLSRPSRWFS